MYVLGVPYTFNQFVYEMGVITLGKKTSGTGFGLDKAYINLANDKQLGCRCVSM
jgi:hypothetical protein